MSNVSFRNVFKSYDKTEVIHGVNLEIEDGEFVVFVGPSGCGKSTLMRMVAGLEDVTGGNILIDSRVVNDLPPRDRDIAMVFQDYALYPNKSVFENMAFGLRLRNTPDQDVKSSVAAAADTLQISHLLDRLPKALSGGQRQRVAMGRAIVRQPKVFLFDEPLSNLDALLRNQVRAEIKKLHRRLKGTIIYVTHDQVEAMTLADRIVVLRAGVIVQVGTPDAIYHQPRHRFVAEFTGSPAMNLVEAMVVDQHGKMALELLGGHHLPLPPALGEAAKGHVDRAVEFGIRPESLQLACADTPAEWPMLSLTVELVEPMGAENLVHFSLSKKSLVGRFGNAVRPPPDTRLAVAFNPGQFYLFDQDSGETLNRY